MLALAPPEGAVEALPLRAARSADIPLLLALFRRCLDDLQARRGEPPLALNLATPERLMRHLIATDPAGALLAEADGLVVAFAISCRRVDSWYLSFLFVDPAWQARGVGSRLLDACLPQDGARSRLAACVEAHQPVATAMYARHGMVPRVPLYLLTGPIATADVPDLPAGFALSEMDPRAAAGLDVDVLGHARADDHRHFLETGRRGWLMQDGEGRLVGYGYAQASGRLGPVATSEPRLLPVLLGHLAGSVTPAGAWQVIVPGPAREALLPLLRAGMRIDGVPALYSATWSGPSFERYLPASYGLL